jgi:hypothetical protein
MDNILATGIIIGLINAIKTQYPQVTGIYAITLSVVLGLLAGYFSVMGVTGIENGLMVGLFASGTYKIAQKVGGN